MKTIKESLSVSESLFSRKNLNKNSVVYFRDEQPEEEQDVFIRTSLMGDLTFATFEYKEDLPIWVYPSGICSDVDDDDQWISAEVAIKELKKLGFDI